MSLCIEITCPLLEEVLELARLALREHLGPLADTHKTLAMRVLDLELSVAVINRLELWWKDREMEGRMLVADLVALTAKDLSDCVKLRSKQIDEVREALGAYKLHLAGES